jgi:hypothetical protein
MEDGPESEWARAGQDHGWRAGVHDTIEHLQVGLMSPPMCCACSSRRGRQRLYMATFDGECFMVCCCLVCLWQCVNGASAK